MKSYLAQQKYAIVIEDLYIWSTPLPNLHFVSFNSNQLINNPFDNYCSSSCSRQSKRKEKKKPLAENEESMLLGYLFLIRLLSFVLL
jgi:hypothetical protein